jgi:tetratricopeptide (TPR) repeat protein
MPDHSRRSASPSHIPSVVLPGELWQYVERLLRRFEEAWRRGSWPSIDDYVKEIDGERLGLLVELVHQDLACRLEAGEAARVEDYLEHYPHLSSNPAVLVDLLASEYLLRQDRGEAVAFEEYQERFPALAGELPRQVALRQGAGIGEAPTLPPPAAAPETDVHGQPGEVVPAEQTALRPAGWAAPEVEWVEVPGYEILGLLGKGGMGVVYRALQTSLGRAVALKVVRHAGSEERRRFHAEAEAIARLKHPNVVQIYEVGEHKGLPYFAMELCEGGSLDGQLDGTPWQPEKAATLVQTLAGAMHAAHAAGVIHRDLKPANVLLAADGTPKITDFGLAKRLDVQGLTQTGAVLGTPSYMAPEQAAGKGKAVGPAADVYALGAILYQLLTGRPPFKGETSFDTLRQVLDDEPVPVRRLQPRAPADLETVCLKCLEKEPQRRYASARELAEDLRRFLDCQPVRARPVGLWEKGWKWARRRPAWAALVAVSLLATAALLLGVAWHNVQLGQALADARAAQTRADDLRQQAETAAEEARKNEVTVRRTADFLTGLFQSAEPVGLQAPGFRGGTEKAAELTARALLDRGAQRVRAELTDQPAVQAALLDTLGNVFRGLGEYDRARQLLQEGLDIRERLYGPEHLDTAVSYFHLGWLYQDLGQFAQAEKFYRRALAIRRAALGNDHLQVAETMFHLAWLLGHQLPQPAPTPERLAEAEQLFREVLRIRQEKLGNDHRDVAFSQLALAALLTGKGGADVEALSLVAQALPILDKQDGGDPAGSTLARFLEAEKARTAGRYDEAERLHRQVLATAQAHLGRRHPITALILGNLAGLLRKKADIARDQGDAPRSQRLYQEAEQTLREALDIGRSSPLRWHPQMIEALNQLADHLRNRGDVQEAERLYREALSLAEYRLKDQPPYRQTRAKLADLLRKQGRPQEAAALERSSP